MKRAAASGDLEDPLTNVKRHKLEPGILPSRADLFESHLRTSAHEVLEQGIGAGTTFLSGKASMSWGVSRGLKKFQMETVDGGDKQRFDVKLSGKCAAHSSLLDVNTGDQFDILLKGAAVERKQDSSKPYFFPMELEFSEGVVIKWTKRARKPAENGTIVDTWALDEEAKRREEAAKIAGEENGLSWFTPPDNPYPEQLLSSIIVSKNTAAHSTVDCTPNTPVARAESPKVALYAPPKATAPPPQPAREKLASTSNRATVVNAPIAGPSRQGGPTASKPRSKKQSPDVAPMHLPVNNRINDHIPPLINPVTSAQETSMPPPISDYGRPEAPAASKPPTKKRSPAAIAPSARPAANGGAEAKDRSHPTSVAAARDASAPAQRPAKPKHSARPISNNASPQMDTPASAVQSNVAPQQAAVPADAEATSVPQLTNKQRRLLKRKLKAMSGTAGPEASTSAVQLVVNPPAPVPVPSLNAVPEPLVEPAAAEQRDPALDIRAGLQYGTEIYAPLDEYGDVIILRGAKWSNQTLVGYGDKLRWSIFSPEQGKVHHGDKGDAPESEGVADGFGYEFGPYWDAQGPELTACLRYADWWRAMLKIAEKHMGRVHQIGPEDAPPYVSKARRVHRLVGDASPDLPPRGFFDCTVEILKGYLNDNGVYSVYVTDYTRNPATAPVQAEWCPPELGDCILKVEMWDAASALAQTMETGEYWFLRNCRIKASTGGYLEGTMQLAEKVAKLDESDAEFNTHLAALLQRKSDWEKTNQGRDFKFEHKSICDVRVTKEVQYFTCTVEMLSVEHNPNGVSCCYITDYTCHPDLPIIPETHPWARGLERRIVKVALWDGQADMAKNIEAGKFYTIRNLRLLLETTGGRIQGRLGGAERLIDKLRSGDSNNERLATLLRNKQKWEEDNIRGQNEQTSSPDDILPETYPPPGFSSIREVLDTKEIPNKHLLRVHIRDFFPFSLEQFVMRRCKHCDKKIDDRYLECLPCLDVETTVRHVFCFFFLLEDADGKELLVSVSDECPLLQGLATIDLREDPSILQELTDRLEPFIGNLVDVHKGISRGEQVARRTPALNISIGCWQNENVDTVTYGLLDVELARL
ncbi:hypothetical protein HWV62_39613 [Athelia sp. TMB]|nr:hypothetical protein HWV62_39613 [Athelia sp. TMB]